MSTKRTFSHQRVTTFSFFNCCFFIRHLSFHFQGNYFGCRHIFAMLGFLGYASAYMTRVNISVAIVDMMHHSAPTDSDESFGNSSDFCTAPMSTTFGWPTTGGVAHVNYHFFLSFFFKHDFDLYCVSSRLENSTGTDRRKVIIILLDKFAVIYLIFYF